MQPIKWSKQLKKNEIQWNQYLHKYVNCVDYICGHGNSEISKKGGYFFFFGDGKEKIGRSDGHWIFFFICCSIFSRPIFVKIYFDSIDLQYS